MVKIIIKITIAIVTLLSMLACEDVVDIDLDTAAPGIYFVRLSGNKISRTYKLVKI